MEQESENLNKSIPCRGLDKQNYGGRDRWGIIQGKNLLVIIVYTIEAKLLYLA